MYPNGAAPLSTVNIITNLQLKLLIPYEFLIK